FTTPQNLHNRFLTCACPSRKKVVSLVHPKQFFSFGGAAEGPRGRACFPVSDGRPPSTRGPGAFTVGSARPAHVSLPATAQAADAPGHVSLVPPGESQKSQDRPEEHASFPPQHQHHRQGEHL